MPALVMFGRRWSLGTDDFVLPSLMDLVIRISWFVATILTYWLDVHGVGCASGVYVKVYFYGQLLAIPLIFFLDFWLLKVSSRGGVMDTHTRRRVPLIIYLRIFGELLSLIWNIIGIISFWNISECPEVLGLAKHKRLRCFVILNLMSALSFGLFWICAFDPLGRDHMKIKAVQEIENNDTTFELGITHRSRYWERRLGVFHEGLLYVPFSKIRSSLEGFKEVGKIFGHYVQDYDLVITDFLVGLAGLPIWKLEQQRQARVIHYSNSEYEKNRVEFDKIGQYFEVGPNPDNSEVLEMRHYNRYITIIYGWHGLLAHYHGKRLKAFRRIYERLRCCGNLRPRSDGAEIEGDNWWQVHTACLVVTMQIEHLKKVDLIYASFVNDYYQSPFCLTVDHPYKSIVITVRGAHAGYDFITSMTAWPVVIPGFPETFRVHHGFLMTASNVATKVKQYLEKIQTIFPDYKLVLTGYSMGGAIASILGMLLRSEFPDLKVYAFSPPGGVLNLEATKWASIFITSIVLGSDLVPRVSLYSAEKYVSEVISAIQHCRTPKYIVLLAYLPGSVQKYSQGPVIEFELPVDNVKEDNEITIQEPELTYSSLDIDVRIPMMFIPGRVIEVDESEGCERDEIFSAVNPGSLLTIWSFIPIMEQFRNHSSLPIRAAFRRFRKLKSESEPEEEPEVEPQVSDDIAANTVR